MKHVILMVPIGLGSGLTTICRGMQHAIEEQGVAVRYFNPFSSNLTQTEHLLSAGKQELVIQSIVDQILGDKDRDEILIIQGAIASHLSHYASRLNSAIAKALDAEVIFVTTPRGNSPQELKERITIAAQLYGEITNPQLIGCIINKVGAPTDQYGNVRIDLFDQDKDPGECVAFTQIFKPPALKVIGCIPWKRELMAPRVKDVAQFLNARVISSGDMETARVNFFAMASATLEHISNIFKPDVMILTPWDRSDAILGTCIAYLSGIKIAGLLLTNGYPFLKNTMRLCRDAMRKGLPFIQVQTDSLQTAIALQNLNLKVPQDDRVRLEGLKVYVASHIDTQWVKTLISKSVERRLSPPAFKYFLVEEARKADKRIVLPEGEEPRIIQAAATCVARQIARPVLMGSHEKIALIAKNHGIVLPDSIEIIDPIPLRKQYLPMLLEKRKTKGLSLKHAEEALQDPVVVGTLMLANGEMDGLVAGVIHTTADTIRPALMLIKTKPGVKKVSSVFFMCLPKQVLVYGDCAVNQNPTAEELADIAIQCADSAKRFGIPPRVAMISYSTGSSGTGEDVLKVKQATALVKNFRPDILIDGPLQYDAAFSPEVAVQKAPKSPIAGKATVYVFPDLNTANTTYKAVQRSANVLSIGPMLQGLKKPVNDLSRGALIEDIIYTIAITAIQAE